MNSCKSFLRSCCYPLLLPGAPLPLLESSSDVEEKEEEAAVRRIEQFSSSFDLHSFFILIFDHGS